MDATTIGILALFLFFMFKKSKVSSKIVKVLSPSLVRNIETIANKLQVPANIVGAVVFVESSGNPLIQGSIGERGLMQLTKNAVQDVNQNFGTTLSWNLMFTTAQNLIAGTLFLKLQKQRMGNWNDAIRAYNAGESGARQGRGFEYLKRVQKWL